MKCLLKNWIKELSIYSSKCLLFKCSKWSNKGENIIKKVESILGELEVEKNIIKADRNNMIFMTIIAIVEKLKEKHKSF